MKPSRSSMNSVHSSPTRKEAKSHGPVKLPSVRGVGTSLTTPKKLENSTDELLQLKGLLCRQQSRLNELCQYTKITMDDTKLNDKEYFSKNVLHGLTPQQPILSATKYNPNSLTPLMTIPKEEKNDCEVQALDEKLDRCQSCIVQIQMEATKSWEGSGRNSSAVLMPPQPPVLLAKTDREISEMAAQACNFALSGRQKTPNKDANACRALASIPESSQVPMSPKSGDRHTIANQSNEMEHSLTSMSFGRPFKRLAALLLSEDLTGFMDSVTNAKDTLVSPTEVRMARTGEVLSVHHILKVDLQDVLRNRKGNTGPIVNAPFFRLIPKLNVAGVAQPNISAVQTVLNAVQRTNHHAVIWVNLREEPLIYINDVAYIVRERSEPLNPMIIPNITGRGIAQMEEKLKQEVLKEARENGGNISVYMEGKDGVVEDQWESVDADHVYTLQEVFDMLRPKVIFYRCPITRKVGAQLRDFDFVFDLCLKDPHMVIVFNCQSGRGKTSTMMTIASIVRFYQRRVADAAFDDLLLRADTQNFNFRTIKKIVSLIPDGLIHERRLMLIMELSGKVYSIIEHINRVFGTGSGSSEEAIMHLQQYAYFIVFSYYCEQRIWGFYTKAPFSVWLSEKNEFKLLIARIQSMEEEFKEERIVVPIAKEGEAWASSIVHSRKGNVLSAGRILCTTSSEANDSDNINMLRQLGPDVPIFTCGRLSEGDRKHLVAEIRRCFPEQKRIQWISLRAEPMVFINDVGFTLTDYDTVVHNPVEFGSTMHVSLYAIEQIEERLRRDVLLESREYNGEILLHRVDEDGTCSAIRVKVLSVRTPKDIMTEFTAGEGIDYHRVPIPFSGHMLPSDIDPLLEYLSRHKMEHDVFIINDAEGSTRTTVALNILTIFRASCLCDLRRLQNPEDFTEALRVGHNGVVLPSAEVVSSIHVSPEELPRVPIELQVASKICQILTAGSLLKVVDAAINLGGFGTRWNILHLLNHLKEMASTASEKVKAMRVAVCMLRTYLLVLLSAIYIDLFGDYSVEEPFSEWLGRRVEVSNVMTNLEQHAEESLTYVKSQNLMKADVSRRNGDVLTANFALKADHFPGCQKKGLRPKLCGAPNFRKVHAVNVYGVAIPTILGIHNLLALLGASQEPFRTYHGEKNDEELYIAFAAARLFDPMFCPKDISKPLRGHVVWVNLREEPILYVGDKPFVFRNLDTPYVNVELTGIAAQKVEHVETKLLADVLHEAEKYNGMFLVHDEDTPGELVGIWEKATRETVKTVREVYNELEGKGYRVSLLRIPVTDEQSPSVDDFDALVTALLPLVASHMDRHETLSFVFNCQMGRGRTTTGMVICCLLIGLVIPSYFVELESICNPLYKSGESPLSNGEYSCIVQLKRLLIGGRNAKHRVDLVIEACSAMQNLRTSIESFVLQVKSPDVTEAQRGRAHHHGVHYLRRYFNLIAFAAYLEEEYLPEKKKMRCTHASWIAQRPELTTLCELAALK